MALIGLVSLVNIISLVLLVHYLVSWALQEQGRP